MARELLKTERMNQLIDIYRPLLTPYQIEIAKLYYFEDWSLSEIAENKKVTRNAIFTLIHRVSKKLEMFEQQMQLTIRFQSVLKHLEFHSIDTSIVDEIRALLFDRKDDSNGI